MSIIIYFINDTKKQVVSTKKIYGDFEDKRSLLCYLTICQGDSFRTEFEDSEWVIAFNSGYLTNYRNIKLHEFKILPEDDLYDSIEFHRLIEVVRN